MLTYFADGPIAPRGSGDSLERLPDQVEYAPTEQDAVSSEWNAIVPAYYGLLATASRRWKPAPLTSGGSESGLSPYIDLSTGKRIPLSKLIRARDLWVDGQAAAVKRIAQRLADGEITLQQWEASMRLHIKMAFAGEYALGRGGLRKLSATDWQKLGPVVKEQYAYLHRFAAQIAEGKLSTKQIVARAAMYMRAATQAHSLAQAALLGIHLPAHPGDCTTRCMTSCRCEWQLRPREDGAVEATWIARDDDRVCPDCEDRAETWNPLVLVPANGGPNV